MKEERKELLRLARLLWGYLAISDSVFKFESAGKIDALFCMGSGTLAPVRKTAKLFEMGLVPFNDEHPVIFYHSTEGTFDNPKWRGKTITEVFTEEFLRLGVPADALGGANETDNTLLEVLYALYNMTLHGLKPYRIVVVSRPVHQRRSFATWQQQWPWIEICNQPAIEEELFEPTEENLIRINEEMERLLLYSDKKPRGDIAPQIMSAEVITAFVKFQQMLKKIF